MKKILISFSILFILFILWKSWKVYYQTQIHEIQIFNKSGTQIDSITIFTNKLINLKNSHLDIDENKTFKVDISKYQIKGKEGFFSIKLYQNNYYISSIFNYHDNWKMLPKSTLYVYKDFVTLAEMKNPQPNSTQQKFKIER